MRRRSILTFLLLSPFLVTAQLVPTNFLSENSFSTHFNGNGVSFVDFNLDGFDDITFGTPEGPVFLVNDQDGGFEETDLGVSNTGDAKHPMWVDVDNDGDLDFFTTNAFSPNRLWINEGNNTFLDITDDSGLIQSNLWDSHGASWGDYDNDGDLDVYITNQNYFGTITNYLFRNNGDLTFTNVNNECMCSNGVQNSFQSLWIDYDKDNLLDLVVINDRLDNPNTIYKNLGDGSFDDVGANLNFNQGIYAMSITVGDFDNDDDDDIYVSNGIPGNLFMRYDEDSFTNIAGNLGMQVFEVCWGAQWIDLENDGDEDLFVSTYDGSGEVENEFFVNQTDDFISSHGAIGFDMSDVHGCAHGDYNNDGFGDIVLHTYSPNYRVLSNTPNDNNWVKVNLKGSVSNAFGVGATIHIYNQGQLQKRTVFCGEDYMSQDSYTELFGLGTMESIDSLVVSWPSGWQDVIENPPVKTTLTIVEGVTFEPNLVLNGTQCSDEITTLSPDAAYASFEWLDEFPEELRTITSSGEYSAVFINSFGLIDTVMQQVDIYEAPAPEVNTTHVTCFGGQDAMIELFNVSGVVVEDVNWNEGAYAGEAIFGLEAGAYAFVMTDVNGCTFEDEITITQPNEIIPNLSLTQPLCFGEVGSAETAPEGGTGELVSSYNAEDNTQLPAGSYEVTVEDEAGCEVTIPFDLVAPEELLGEVSVVDANEGNNGEATVEVEGGVEPYTIVWSNGDIGIEADELGQGSHFVIVTDDNGCIWSETFGIVDTGIEENEVQYRLQTALNGDLQVVTPQPIVFYNVINSAGQIVQSSEVNTLDLLLPSGAFQTGIYVVSIQLADGQFTTFKVYRN
ncbi:MAG: FG-GAP-like repeat-containing protein [Flavobacteriales bacterium]|nr:FG-GAP-like repeat-containing protein [Flavobacteriales bacterium]